MISIGLMTVHGFRMAIGLTARGSDADLVGSETAYQCTLSKLKAQWAENLRRPMYRERSRVRLEYTKPSFNLPVRSKKETLEKAIAAAVKKDGYS